MRIVTQGLGIELKREGHAYLEYAVFAALREFLPRIGRVNVCLRATGREDTAVQAAIDGALEATAQAVRRAVQQRRRWPIERMIRTR